MVDRDTARQRLELAAALRMPWVPAEDGKQKRIDALEDYILEMAPHQGDLAEARLSAHDRLEGNERLWREVMGWETFRRGKTDASIDEAKRVVKPELYEELETDRQLVKRLSEQIDRLEADFVKASRAYSMMTGT